MANPKEKPREEASGVGEIPFCYDLLGQAAGDVFGVSDLYIKISDFGCTLDCGKCIIQTATLSEQAVGIGVLSPEGIDIVSSVRRLYAAAMSRKRIGEEGLSLSL